MEVDLAEDTSIIARSDNDGSLVGLLQKLSSFVSARERSVGVWFRDRGDFAGDVLGVGVTLVRGGFKVNNIWVVFLSCHDDDSYTK